MNIFVEENICDACRLFPMLRKSIISLFVIGKLTKPKPSKLLNASAFSVGTKRQYVFKNWFRLEFVLKVKISLSMFAIKPNIIQRCYIFDNNVSKLQEIMEQELIQLIKTFLVSMFFCKRA